MKRYVFLMGLILICTGGVSQEIPTRYSPVNNNFFGNLVKEVSRNPANYSYVPIRDYTASTLFYEHEDGNLKQGAIPETIQKFGIETNGIYRNANGILFFGDLSIGKSYYDNLKWNLSYQLPEKGRMPDPHYFGVSKGARWSNQEYNISGGMILPVADKLSILVNATYHLFNKYRTDLDPRPKITYNELGFHGGLNYEINQKHHLKISGQYGYNQVENNVDFSNKDNNIPYNHDIYVKWIAGYGSLISPFKSTTKRRFSQVGYNLGYSYISDKNLILADFSYRKKEQVTFRSGNVEDEKDPAEFFGTYSPQSLNVSLTGLRFINEENLLKASLEAEKFSGNNFITSKGGKSYSANEKKIKLSFSYLNQFTNGISNLDAGVHGEWWQVKQRDALSATLSDITNFDLGAYILKSYEVRENLRINPFAEVVFSYNLNSEFTNGSEDYLASIPQNDYAGLALKAYYKEVIYPDVEMLSTNRIDFSAGASINFISSGGLDTLIKLKAGVKNPLQDLEYFDQTRPNRWYGLTSLTIYY